MRALVGVFALAVLVSTLDARQRDDRAELLLQTAIHKELTEGDLKEAIRLYQEIANRHSGNRAVAARALVNMGRCYEKLGTGEAQKAYERVLAEYGDQSEASKDARTRLAAIARKPRPREALELVSRRLTSGHATGVSGLSRDGRYLSDPDWETGNLQITDFETGRTRRLTHKGAANESEEFAYFSAFSPDDKHVAYVWFAKSGRYEIRVTTFDGTQTRTVYDDEETNYITALDWSPDGRSLLAVVTRKDNTNQITIVPVSGGRPRVLKTLDWRSPFRTSFSPDGRFIAYSFPPADEVSERDVFAIAVDGSREVPLVQHPADDFVIGWAPDGQRFVFGSDRQGNVGAWIVNVQDGRPMGPPTLLRSDLGPHDAVRLTPGGSYYYRVDIATNDVYVATLDSTLSKVVVPPTMPVARFDGTNSFPEWSPDGREVAYVTNFTRTKGRMTLRIHSLDSGKQRELTPSLAFFNRPRWSPDGRWFLVCGRDDRNRGGLFKIDAQTGESVMIAPSAGMPRESAWFRDGKSILYWDLGSGRPIVKRDLETGAEQDIHAGGVFALSPDDRWLAVSHGVPHSHASVLTLVSMGGGESRELMKAPDGDGGAFGGCTWAPDSRHMLCTRTVPSSMAELWRLSIDGDPPHRVVAIDRMNGVRLSPDGRRIAFSAGTRKSELWVMEHFVPPPPTKGSPNGKTVRPAARR